MNTTTPQAQMAAVTHGMHNIVNQLKSSAPHSDLTHSMERHAEKIKGMVAAGKSQVTIDEYMKGVHNELHAAQMSAYNHNTPDRRFGPAQPGQAGHFGATPVQGQYGHMQGQTGYGANAQTSYAGSHAPTQNTGHFTPGPSAHSIGNADYMLRNMSKGLHGGYAKF